MKTALQTSVVALAAALLFAGALLADDRGKVSPASAQSAQMTITKVDAKKGEITVKYAGENGKPVLRTFQLTDDTRLIDETGRVVKIDVFESGQDVLVIESEGKLKSLRRHGSSSQRHRLSDHIRTLIEMTELDESHVAEVQRIYDQLRKLDTANNGKIDLAALKMERERIVEDRVRSLIERLDVNKDGKISKEEARGLIKEHFEKLDIDKDGSLTFEELLKAVKERRDSKVPETEKK